MFGLGLIELLVLAAIVVIVAIVVGTGATARAGRGQHSQATRHPVLTAIPKHWFSWDFTVMEGPQPVGEIDVSWWRDKGVLTVQGVAYRVYREGVMSGDFVLASARSVLARARKPNAFRRSFIVEHADRQYTLRARSVFQRAFALLDGNREVGSLSPRGIFTRRATVDLPTDLPLCVKVFITWLAVILWKRESDSAAAAGTT